MGGAAKRWAGHAKVGCAALSDSPNFILSKAVWKAIYQISPGQSSPHTVYGYLLINYKKLY